MAKRTKLSDHERSVMHRDVAEQVHTLILRCGWLRDHGKLDESRRLLVRIEKLTKELKQFEDKEPDYPAREIRGCRARAS